MAQGHVGSVDILSLSSEKGWVLKNFKYVSNMVSDGSSSHSSVDAAAGARDGGV